MHKPSNQTNLQQICKPINFHGKENTQKTLIIQLKNKIINPKAPIFSNLSKIIKSQSTKSIQTKNLKQSN